MAEIFLKQVVFQRERKGHSKLGLTYLILFCASWQFPLNVVEPVEGFGTGLNINIK